jgi:AmmeMemoRadiSam system protein B
MLRSLEMFPLGSGRERLHVLRDPEGFGKMLALPDGAALVVLLMDGRHTLPEIQRAFQQRVGAKVSLSELETIVRKLDDAYLLHGQRFERQRRRKLKDYAAATVRPAAHAGGGYAERPEDLCSQLDEMLNGAEGPGRNRRNGTARGQKLRGIVSPHIDLARGGPLFAWSYQRLAQETTADVFVIFGTAHQAMRQMFSVTRKDFATPLGTVATDQRFIDLLAAELNSSVAGRGLDLFADELGHRLEHSIEFQVVWLQYMLGAERAVRIVPILVGSFYELMLEGTPPDESPEVQAMLAALRKVEAEYQGRVCYISGADLAHIGRRFGDDDLLDEPRLDDLAADDRRMLAHACRGDANAFYRHVARKSDCNRICGLAPTYMLLSVLHPCRAKLLRYDQAIEPDGTSCVSFASLAVYGK